MEPGEWRIDRFIIQDKAGNSLSSNNEYGNKMTSAGFITFEKDDLREKKIIIYSKSIRIMKIYFYLIYFPSLL